MVTRADLARQRDDVLRVCERESTASELLADLTRRLRETVPFTGSACFGLDPSTLLPTSPTLIENVHPTHCESFWAREFLVEDTNLFLSMAHDGTPAAALVEATARRPARSARYREFLAPQGYGDELRALLRADHSAWGSLSLYRSADDPPFSPEEVAFVAGLTRPVAEAMRARVVARAPSPTADPAGPGVLLFDRAGALLNVNDEALAWLDHVPDIAAGPSGVPSAVLALLAHADAVAEGRERGPSRLRLRTSYGRWLVVHASHLPAARGASNTLIAVVVEPAASSEIAPIIVEAYALTAREQEIISALARGLTTAEVAQQYFLSAHTVRDYVKSIFGKVGVSSRGELVAKLFADHYAGALHGTPADHPDRVASRGVPSARRHVTSPRPAG